MKKLLLIVLVCVLALSMFACSNNEVEDDSTVSDLTQHNTANLYDANEKNVGSVKFNIVGGESAELVGYVGIHEEHTIKLEEKIGDNGYTVTGIGKDAFLYCTTLKSITLPKTLTYIEDFAFAGCTNIESITIPAEVTYIGKGAFSGCTSLKEIIFEGNELELIDSYAFNGCTALEKINFPEGLETIGDFTFNGCAAITSFKAPSTIKKIGQLAFYDCKGLNAKDAVDLSAAVNIDEADDIAEFAFVSVNKHNIKVPEDAESAVAKYVAAMKEFAQVPQN